jgi:hypothetical protein
MSLSTEEKTETVHVPGSRLQPVCRKLGIPFGEHFSHWEKNSSRHYPDRRVYDGVDVAPADAEKLNTYLADRDAKETAKNERRAALLAMPEADRLALRAKKQAAQEKRVAREMEKITGEVNRRWTLDAADVAAFAEHANEPGEGRVLRTKTACSETFETKVYMALVAWVRHNYTGYDDALTASKDRAYAEYLDAKENGDDWETKAQLLDDARAEHRQNHASLHKQFTDEAVAWLKNREVKS